VAALLPSLSPREGHCGRPQGAPLSRASRPRTAVTANKHKPTNRDHPRLPVRGAFFHSQQVRPMPFDPWNTDDGFPDDWFQPPSSSAPGTAQPTFGASPNPFNPLLTSAPPSSFSPFGAQPTFNPRQSPFNPVFTNLLPPSHPLSPYFGLSPDEWVRAQALVAPTFPDAFGQFPRPSPLPPPPPIAASALFGDLTRRLLERTAPAPIGLFGNTAWHPAEVGDAPSISGGGQFDSLANRQPAALSSQANAPFAPPSDAFASQSFIPPASLALRRLRPRSKRRLPSADCQRSPDIPDCTRVARI